METKVFCEKLERILSVALTLLAFTLFFSQSALSLFGGLSLLMLIILRLKCGPSGDNIPRLVLWSAGAFALSLAISVFVSSNHQDAFSVFMKIWHLLMLGLLVTTPISKKTRRTVVVGFLSGAAVAGGLGLFQLVLAGERGHGFTHPVHYAGMLAVACSFALMVAMVPNDLIKRTPKWRAFIWLVIVLTFVGLVSTVTRGVLLAFGVAVLIVLASIDWRKAAAFILVLVLVFGVAYATDETVRNRVIKVQRAVDDSAGSSLLEQRLRLWKAGLVMFKEQPVFGTGSGDWRAHLQLIIDKSEGLKIREGARVQAHNVYVQWLATQGIVGLTALLSLISAMFYWSRLLFLEGKRIGSYVIFINMLVLVIWGMVESNLMIGKYFAALSIAVGLSVAMAGEFSRGKDTP